MTNKLGSANPNRIPKSRKENLKETLKLTRRVWKAFHNIGDPAVFQIVLDRISGIEPPNTIAYNNAKAKYKACNKELCDSLNALQKVAPHLEVIKKYASGELLEEGY